MTSASSVLAVALAAVGALFFGLASVRQHGVVQAAAVRAAAVQAAAAPARAGRWEQVLAGLRVVRQRAWLLGVVQAGLGGGLHVVALGLAPITLVQPVGVLAVPVTVVASSLAGRRRPARSQVLGTLLSVVGVAALTVVLLLRPAAQPGVLPPWRTLAVGSGIVLAAGCAVALVLGRARPPELLRCVSRAGVAATVFGVGSVLVRTLGKVVASSPTDPVGLVGTALVGIAVAFPLGLWAMQSAYLFGPPQVVVCCLTLVDPLTAVVGGRALLQDGAAITGSTLLAALACAAVVAGGVVLLARGRTDPVDALVPVGGRAASAVAEQRTPVHRTRGGA